MREVRVIPAIREFATGQGVDQLRPKRKVAGYARVSTDRVRMVLNNGRGCAIKRPACA